MIFDPSGQVREQLPRVISAHNSQTAVLPLECHAPLEISDDQQMKSYKEAWNPHHCHTSIQTTGLYEASGNIAWIDMENSSIPFEDPSWALVTELATGLFMMLEPDIPPDKVLVFPIIFDTYVLHHNDLPTQGMYPCKLLLLGGHPIGYAWYLATWRALRSDDVARVKVLWTSALCTTIRLRVEGKIERLAAASMALSETVKLQEKGMADTFVTFSRKLAYILVQCDLSMAKTLEHLGTLGVRFGGSPINRIMLQTSHLIDSLMNDAAAQALIQIDREFGKDVMSKSYNKLMRVLQTCKATPTGKSVTLAVEFVFQMMLISLRRRMANTRFFTLDVLDKQRDGTPGWVQTTLAKFQVIQVITAGVPEVPVVLQVFRDPISFHKGLPIEAADLEEAVGVSADLDDGGAADDLAGDEEAATSDQLAVLTEGLSKGGVLLVELLYGLYSGLHDEDLQTLATQPQNLATHQHTLNALDSDQKGELSKKFREMQRAYCTSVVGVSTAAPEPSMRALARLRSDPDDRDATLEQVKQERQTVWRQVQTIRKKYVQLGLWKCDAQDGLEQIYAKCPVRSFSGAVLESHRLFVWSGDLITEAQNEPWTNMALPEGPMVDEPIQWMVNRRGPADIILGLDGRSRQLRKKLDALMESATTVEIWIAYQGGKNLVAKKETGLLRLPCKPAKFGTVTEIYADVQARKARSLPQLDPEEKGLVHGFTNNVPATWAAHSSGVPLFWQEVRPVSFWQGLLEELKVKSVFDLSPGSGALASACLLSGEQYFGVCRNETHQNWLANVVDRMTMSLACDASTPVHQVGGDTLATAIKDHFPDVLDEIAAREDADDEDIGDEEAQE